jgi:spore germination cell wall hydrolase CwlJ-like protein
VQAFTTGIRAIIFLCGALALAACEPSPAETAPPPPEPAARDVDCMARAMYFESFQSSRDGLIAVGSVVMNRVESDAYPDDVCQVVSQRNQFAPGVMTRPMVSTAAANVRAAARAVLTGERHPQIGRAQFFHVANYRAGYNNMHYVLTAGGNAFYERRRPEQVSNPRPLPPTEGVTAP